ncbi:MAG: AMP-binding protein [Acidobacteriota bacterium]
MKDSYLDYGNVFEILCDQASTYPDRDALVFLGDDGKDTRITYARLVEISRQYGEAFKRGGLGSGDIAMLLLPHSLEIIYSFFGGISCGVVPSIYPYPALNTDKGKSCGMIKEALRNIKAGAFVTSSDLSDEFLDTGCAGFRIEDGLPVETVKESAGLEPVRLNPWIAYLQLTSGTTGSSKGVLLTHRNILYFLESTLKKKPWPYTFWINWIPLYHTGALMGALLLSLMSGMTLALMSPSRWIIRPISFFRFIDRFRADRATLPNSGFVHALKYVDDRELAKLDLSCLKKMTSAGEPAGAAVIERFYDKFGKAGLERQTFSNAYGQAEVTALTSDSFYNGGFPVDRIDADLFYNKGIARKTASDFSGSSLSVVSCGKPVWGMEVKIIGNDGNELPERHSGEVLARSEAVFEGYHLDPAQTAETIKDGWLHTGDVGYLADGELYICDRKKDLIITGGKNVRPGDIEGIVYAEIGDCVLCAAFGIYDDDIGTERVVLVCEWSGKLELREKVGIEKKIRRLVYSGLYISLDDFQIVEPGWIVRTTTKKISRKATGEKFREEFLQTP